MNLNQQPKRRFGVMAVSLILCFTLLTIQLANLQLVKGDAFLKESENKRLKTQILDGTRGAITDVNGVVLAYNEKSYQVQFFRDTSQTKKSDYEAYTQSILRVIEIIEKSGGKTISDFSIVRNEQGELVFDFLTKDAEIFAKREKQWRQNFYVTKTSLTVQDIYDKLVDRYALKDYDEETQRKVLSVWQEWQMNVFLGEPITIAEDIDFKTVAVIEAEALHMRGISIAESTYRVYPWGNVACHILGYTGKMTDEDTIERYKEKGYSPTDLIGVSGIEKSMEEQLSGCINYRQGYQKVEVDSMNHVTRLLSSKRPSNGNTVALTIDLDLQKVAQEALEKNITQIRTWQIDQILAANEKTLNEYAQELSHRAESNQFLHLAQTGAVIVMDVNTGKVRAMVSYPGYDPNDFSGGIDMETYRSYLDDPRIPLFNRAISTRSTPGSIFKPLTALAGLAEGIITENTYIDDKGPYDVYDKTGYAPKCWVKPHYEYHKQLNVVGAIKESCNYFFYKVSDQVGIEKLHDWSTKLGLTTKTGIELSGEIAGSVGNQKVLYNPDLSPYGQETGKANYVAFAIKNRLSDVGEELGKVYDTARLDRVVKELMDLVVTYDWDQVTTYIRPILLEQLGLSSAEISSRYLVTELYSYLREIRWTGNETILSGIGQSITELTPIGVARYLSALVNGGVVYEAQIVDRILSSSGEVLLDKEPVVVNRLENISQALDLIQQGMHGVISPEDGGTAASEYGGFPYLNEMGAKTGSAQVNNIDVENSAWQIAFAPFENPEIAVVAFIPNGQKGAKASLTVKEIIAYYMENRGNTNMH